MKSILEILNVSDQRVTPILGIMILGVFSSLCGILPIEIIRSFAETHATGESSSIFSKPMALLGINSPFETIVAFLAIAAAYIVLRNVYGYLAGIYTNSLIRKVQDKVFHKQLISKYEYHIQTSAAKQNHLLISDCQRLELVFSQPLYTALSDLFDLLWLALLIYLIEPALLVVLLVSIPLILVASKTVGKKQRSLFSKVQHLESDKFERSEIVLNRIDSIKAMEMENFEAEEFSRKNGEILANRNEATKKLAFFFPLEGSIRYSAIAITLLIFTFQAEFSPVTLLALLAYSTKFFAPISNFNKYYMSFANGLASVTRILVVLNSQTDEVRSKGDIKIDSLELRGISVRIPGGKQIDITEDIVLANGAKIHISGESGKGKSTLAKAILGFLPYAGDIRLNDQVQNPGKLSELRQAIIYVSQDPLIIPGTLRENVFYGKHEIEKERGLYEEIIQQLNLSHLEERQRLKERDISGGERKRIAVARALMSRGDLIIFDEVISNLDEDSRALVEQSINERFKEKLLLFISHNKLSDPAYKEVSI